jgi:hypothetical protein
VVAGTSGVPTSYVVYNSFRVNAHDVAVMGFSGGQTRLESENAVAGHGLEHETSGRAVHWSGGEKDGQVSDWRTSASSHRTLLAQYYTWLAPTLR